MTLLAIDPSSTATGWAVLRPENHELLDYGVWRGSRKDDPYVRIGQMCISMGELLKSVDVDGIVVEVTSGHVGARHAGQGSGLAVYGAAVGGLWIYSVVQATSISRLRPFGIYRVYENEWTGGVPKINRHRLILAEFPEYAKAIGKRHDITDAIGIGMWWWSHRKMLEKTA